MNDAIRTRDCVIADLTTECKELRAELAAERAKVADLTAKLAAKESAEQEPAAFLEFTTWMHNELPSGTIIGDPGWWASRIFKRFIAPQPTPTTSAAVAAFKRSVLTVVQPDDSYQDEWFKAKADCYARVEALPADESALREICMRVAKKARYAGAPENIEAIVDEVLGKCSP